MFGIGMPEMILILVVALIVVGPKKLPELAKSMGKAMGEFKKASTSLKRTMSIETEIKDFKNSYVNTNKPKERIDVESKQNPSRTEIKKTDK